jgi:hypothetical protein
MYLLYIFSRAPHTNDFVILTSLTHPRKILLVVLEIGKAKYLSALLHTWFIMDITGIKIIMDKYIEFEVLTAVTTKSSIFCDVMLCSLVNHQITKCYITEYSRTLHNQI